MFLLHHVRHLSAVWFDAQSEPAKHTDGLCAILQSARGIPDVWCSSMTNWDQSANLGCATVISNGIALLVCASALGEEDAGDGLWRKAASAVHARLSQLQPSRANSSSGAVPAGMEVTPKHCSCGFLFVPVCRE